MFAPIVDLETVKKGKEEVVANEMDEELRRFMAELNKEL
jgi:hypothetical protein